MSILKRKKAGARLAKSEPKIKKKLTDQKEPETKPESGEQKAPKQKKKRTRQERIKLALTVVLIILTVLSAMVIIAYAVYRSWAKPPELPNSVAPNLSVGNNKGGNQGNSNTNDQEPVEGVEMSGDRKEDFYTFLVIGRDTGGGGNTDTILLAAYDVANQKLNVMSIPRDTMVNVSWDIKRINSVYNMYGGGDKGIQALYAEVSQLVGFVPDFEVVIEWKAVGELVNAIEGVWFEVPWNMNYDDPTQNLHIHQAKGYRLLNGNDAMQVVRWRQNNDGSHSSRGDIGRIEIQQAFLKAVISQCLQIQNVTKIRQFAQIFTENVQTDLTMGNLAWFGEQAIFGGLTMDNVNFMTMPGNYTASAWSRTYQNYQSYVTPYGDELLEMVNEYFNPFLEDRTASQQDIMRVNKDGSLSSSTGVVEDTKAAQPPVKTSQPTASSEPSPSVTEKPTTTEAPNTSPDPNASRAPEPSGEPIDPETTPPPEETPPAEPSNEGGTSEPGGQDEPPTAQDPIPTPTTWTPPAPAGDED